MVKERQKIKEEVKKSLLNFNSIKSINIVLFKIPSNWISYNTKLGVIKLKINENQYVADKLLYKDIISHLKYKWHNYDIQIKWLQDKQIF